VGEKTRKNKMTIVQKATRSLHKSSTQQNVSQNIYDCTYLRARRSALVLRPRLRTVPLTQLCPRRVQREHGRPSSQRTRALRHCAQACRAYLRLLRFVGVFASTVVVVVVVVAVVVSAVVVLAAAATKSCPVWTSGVVGSMDGQTLRTGGDTVVVCSNERYSSIEKEIQKRQMTEGMTYDYSVQPPTRARKERVVLYTSTFVLVGYEPTNDMLMDKDKGTIQYE
jgi:hypothetical protein